MLHICMQNQQNFLINDNDYYNMIAGKQILKLSLLLGFAFFTLSTLTACGVKPEFPEAPAGYEENEYPQQYPAPQSK